MANKNITKETIDEAKGRSSFIKGFLLYSLAASISLVIIVAISLILTFKYLV